MIHTPPADSKPVQSLFAFPPVTLQLRETRANHLVSRTFINAMSAADADDTNTDTNKCQNLQVLQLSFDEHDSDDLDVPFNFTAPPIHAEFKTLNGPLPFHLDARRAFRSRPH